MKVRHLLLATLSLVFSSAYAVPVQYNFSATWWIEAEGPNVANFVGPVVTPFFSASDVLSGSFFYDADSPFLSGGTTTVYSGTITNITATVAGHSISDPTGYGAVNEGADWVALVAEPEPYTPVPPEFRNINGFLIDTWALANLRVFWIDDPATNGDLDLIANSALPSVLPPPGFDPYESRVALDFLSPAGDQRHISFFNNLTVTPVAVAEPSMAVLFGLGLVLLAVRVRTSVSQK